MAGFQLNRAQKAQMRLTTSCTRGPPPLLPTLSWYINPLRVCHLGSVGLYAFRNTRNSQNTTQSMCEYVHIFLTFRSDKLQ